jgi:hypothetical protein
MLAAEQPGVPEPPGPGAVPPEAAARAEAATTEFAAAEAAGFGGAAEPEGLPILSIAGGVVATRLRNPKVIAGLAGAAVVVFALRRRRR